MDRASILRTFAIDKSAKAKSELLFTDSNFLITDPHANEFLVAYLHKRSYHVVKSADILKQAWECLFQREVSTS